MSVHMRNRIAALPVLVLLALELAPNPSFARFQVTYARPRYVTRFPLPREPLDSSDEDSSASASEPPVAVEEIPHDHEEPLYRQPEPTQPERIAGASERVSSHPRGIKFSTQSSDSNPELPYTSPSGYFSDVSYTMNFTIGSSPRDERMCPKE